MYLFPYIQDNINFYINFCLFLFLGCLRNFKNQGTQPGLPALQSLGETLVFPFFLGRVVP